MVEQWIENPCVSGSNPLLNKLNEKMKLSQIFFIIKLKNAAKMRKDFIFIKFSIKNLNLIKFLYKEGYILSYFAKDDRIRVNLRYSNNISLLDNIKIFSKPSIKKFLSYKNLCSLNKSNRDLILSTTLGILTYKKCLELKTGGSLLFAL